MDKDTNNATLQDVVEDIVADVATLYTTNIEIMVKDFVNQKNGNSKKAVDIHCNALISTIIFAPDIIYYF